MRITSGDLRGREIKTPPDTSSGKLRTHPMGSREKLALFNSLNAIVGPLSNVSNVLDCYSGSGALGIEALSRGAKEAVLVEKNPVAFDIIQQNLSSLNLSERAKSLKTDVAKLSLDNVRSFLGGDFAGFDLILVDPPYNHFVPAEFNHLEELLADNGILVLSHPDTYDGMTIVPEEIFPRLKLFSDKSYAAANIAIYQHK